jgi:hypothetical protein
MTASVSNADYSNCGSALVVLLVLSTIAEKRDSAAQRVFWREE